MKNPLQKKQGNHPQESAGSTSQNRLDSTVCHEKSFAKK